MTAAAFPAGTSGRAQLGSALEAAATRFGRTDVLEYSPYAGLVRTAPQDVTVEELQPQIDEIPHGAETATQTVLPAMLEAGAGTLLYTVGGGAIIRLNGLDYDTIEPEFLSAQQAKPLVRAAFNPLERPSFKMLGIRQFMRLHIMPGEP